MPAQPTGILLARMPEERRDVVVGLAGEILSQYGRGRAAVAVDGLDGSGKTRFADDLATALRDRGAFTVRASLDGFEFPRAERHRRGRYSAEGYWRDAYDYDTLRRVLLDPWRMRTGAGFTLRSFDLERDAPVESEWLTAPPDAVLVVDGVFAQRRELRGAWNWTAYLEAPVGVCVARASARSGLDPDPETPLWRRYLGAWEIYLRECDPRGSASAIVDTLDLDRPVRVFADSC